MPHQTTHADEFRARHRVAADRVRWTCAPEDLPFETTAGLKIEDSIVGQDRAVRALDFGLSVPQPGYNIFVSGPTGTGRTTYTLSQVTRAAAAQPAPSDWVYVHNFQQADQPLAISLPPGEGTQLRRGIDRLIDELKDSIRKLFASETFEAKRSGLLHSFEQRAGAIWRDLEQEARRLGFALQRTPMGIVTIPVGPSGDPLVDEQLQQLGSAHREELERRARELQESVAEATRKVRTIEREAREALQELERSAVHSVASVAIEPLRQRYADHPKLVRWLDAFLTDVVERHDDFKEDGEPQVPLPLPLRRPDFTRYRVNLFIDHSKTTGAPVVFESNPTYYNLLGKVEYRGEFGALVTDFTMIKPGALHRANGGYLILQARDLLLAPLAWEALKRALKSREVRIENIAEQYGLVPTASLRPEPIPLDVKVVVIGGSLIYHLLYLLDDDFAKLFKIKSDFDVDMERTPETILQYCQALGTICHRQGLLPFDRSAVARTLEQSARLAEHQRRLSMRFNDLVDVLYEASAWARRDGAAVVSAKHVRRAIEERIYRSNRVEERIRQLIREGQILVSVDGGAVGQVNGLSVLQLGDYAFGRPTRITARTFVGGRGVVNIERETQLSGRIHTKGVFTLAAYLGGKYAQQRPLSMSASITFEQTYEEVEGDSASSTELYALLSDLAGVPIDQGIAVTGSVNQKGEVQPIGGVNEKIEGFYYTCKALGLTGRQGVMIPHQNLLNLMLNEEVTEAVRQERFHIWAVRTIDEGLEVLTGVPAGAPDAAGAYPEGTLNALISRRLGELGDRLRRFAPMARTREEGREEAREEGERNTPEAAPGP
ncbi:MAG: ATP-binding protein [Armatimonadota bacterium]|nr:ATP-binding protein [Armatimonadota bacterium]MDR7485123.1 ATP-binding protein [Armatimonadota bacterium]MDR7533511.1 ATP-binding protein [Armatimonadota bacterium]MDR7536988.1 ATP-binding protein [Armatimonadota bacterium]